MPAYNFQKFRTFLQARSFLRTNSTNNTVGGTPKSNSSLSSSCRAAFSEFDAEIVANLIDKQMMSISSEYSIDIRKVRGVVDNANKYMCRCRCRCSVGVEHQRV
ncbi:hypothetical protein MTR_6g052980 [Medicago truncatula]|uniref:Uncharacterized protein n=1 Tax=Medicago truncatula TaxID=3880 RepID=A0A072UAD2_MEDTR|nr:hypothetical protein MTR_6g052980 [Medicago truncatula]